MTDLFFKPIDRHQYSRSYFCHLFHCKKRIRYSRASKLNRICSDNKNFDRGCNDLEKWLMERRYNEKFIRKQMLRAWEYSKNTILEVI